MICDFCKKNFKDELLSQVTIDEGEKIFLCKNCEADLIKANE